jgi:hypothetical protein
MVEPLRQAIVAAGGAVAGDVVTDADLATAIGTPAGREKLDDVFRTLLFADATGAFEAVDVSVGGTGSNRRIDQLWPRLIQVFHDLEAKIYRKYGLVLTGGTGGGVVPAGAAAAGSTRRPSRSAASCRGCPRRAWPTRGRIPGRAGGIRGRTAMAGEEDRGRAG